MRYTATLCLTFLASWIPCGHSFHIFQIPRRMQPASFKKTAPYRSKSTQIRDSSSEASQQGDPPKDLVGKGTFLAAVERLNSELGISETKTGAKEEDDEEPMYAIGRLRVNLAIDSAPGLDLAESTGLVLVSGVSGNAAEAGIQIGDTIVGVSAAAGKYHGNTKALNLEGTASILQASAKLALENGTTEIELELNRLIRLSYYE